MGSTCETIRWKWFLNDSELRSICGLFLIALLLRWVFIFECLEQKFPKKTKKSCVCTLSNGKQILRSPAIPAMQCNSSYSYTRHLARIQYQNYGALSSSTDSFSVWTEIQNFDKVRGGLVYFKLLVPTLLYLIFFLKGNSAISRY